MDYNQNKLKEFTKYLLKKNPELSTRVSPLGISEEYGILSEAEEGTHFSKEDWEEVLKHWNYFKTNVYKF